MCCDRHKARDVPNGRKARKRLQSAEKRTYNGIQDREAGRNAGGKMPQLTSQAMQKCPSVGRNRLQSIPERKLHAARNEARAGLIWLANMAWPASTAIWRCAVKRHIPSARLPRKPRDGAGRWSGCWPMRGRASATLACAIPCEAVRGEQPQPMRVRWVWFDRSRRGVPSRGLIAICSTAIALQEHEVIGNREPRTAPHTLSSTCPCR